MGYSNKRNAAIGEKFGDVRFVNFTAIDNLLAGIEMSLADETGLGTTRIEDALIVGYSANGGDFKEYTTKGIFTPRSDGFMVKNVRFYNFGGSDMAALASCSHCWHPASTDSDARTIRFSELKFFNVSKKISFITPRKAIFLDLDGSLTESQSGPKFITPYYPYNDVPECKRDDNVYDGLVCSNV